MGTKKQKAIFDFLKHARANNVKFDVETVVKVTGWKQTSTKTLLRSRHYSSVVRRTEDGQYVSIIDPNLSFEEFVQAVSQSSGNKTIPGLDNPLVKHLHREARDAFVLAIELFNRPSIPNKHGPFAVILAMAWEKLLKARLIAIEGKESVIFEDGNSLGFEKCIRKVFPNPNGSTGRNLLELKEMRDGSVHLLVPEIGNLTTPFFQAAVINFRRCYEEWTQEPLLQLPGSGLMSLVLANEPIKSVHLQSLYGEQLASQISQYAESLYEKIASNQSDKYCVSIEVTLKQVKSNEQADLLVSRGKNEVGVPVIPDPTTVKVEEVYPFRPHRARDAVNARLSELGIRITLTMDSFNAVVFKAKIRGDNRYHRYDKLGNYHSYSQGAIDKIVDLIRHGKDYVSKAIRDYRDHLNKQKKPNQKVKP